MTGPQSSAPPPANSPGRWIALPVELVQRLDAFRGRVRRIKLFEAACVAVVGVAAAFLTVFSCDRLGETPVLARLGILVAAIAACLAVPLAIRRWGIGLASLEQVARLIERRFPTIGDELLGIIDIVRTGATGQSRSRSLCEAAVAQVAGRSEAIDFREAMPPARPARWALAAALPVAACATLACLAPDAALNAWRRLIVPWAAVERFTFARVRPLPDRVVVPHGEPATVRVAVRDDTRWRPAEAQIVIGDQRPVVARLDGDTYSFTMPPQVSDAPLTLAVGDVRQRVRLEAIHRPELAGLEAEVALPDYLQRPGTRRQDIRGGMLAPVKGSRVAIVATANRTLAGGTVDGVAVETDGAMIRTPAVVVADPAKTLITWRDGDGLEAAAPLELVVAPRGDEPPTVVMLDVPQTRGILLETDTLKFKVAARDDFGIRRVGLEWEGLDDPYASGGSAGDAAAREQGERILQAGGGEVEAIDAAATFCPDALGIRPQPIAIRAFAEDFLPGRGRAVSSPLVLYVVDRAEHALVLNTRLQQFRQQASEVRDREMGLLATNKELRKLPAEQLVAPEARARLEAQAAAEDANARRLERLVDEGADLVREALKNPEFEAGTLEELAEDIQTLAEIAERRMPGVADLLAQAASGLPAAGSPRAGDPATGKPGEQQPRDAQPQPDETAEQRTPDGEAPRVGEQREQPGAAPPEGIEESPSGKPAIPQVVDIESSQQPKENDPQAPSEGGSSRFGLPTTQAGAAPPKKPVDRESQDEQPAEEALDEAIARQEELLAEFAKVADELAAVMARLEGSTFVKRLKLAAREQGAIGSRIAALAAEAFGAAERRPEPVTQALGDVRTQSLRETERMSALMDDLQAYFDRRQLPAFRTVLEEMKDLDTLGSLRQLSDDVLDEAGMSIAQAEFWSDTFDRLADDLVPPPCEEGGQGSGPQRESMPPEVVLEAMKILEEEVNLREETRVAEQARNAVEAGVFSAQARNLADRQDVLAGRIDDLVERLVEEPEGDRQFAPEIQLFEKVEEVMAEATDILATPDTGPKAIGAETEAIELLLAAQAAAGNPAGGGGGGGGGSTPGGGGSGKATSAALALAGRGNRSGRGEGGEKDQATGTSGRVLPEEFRAGLDAYFNRFEKERR